MSSGGVELVTDPCAVDAPGISELLDTVAGMREARGWRYVAAATDLPLLLQDRPAVAEWVAAEAWRSSPSPPSVAC